MTKEEYKRIINGESRGIMLQGPFKRLWEDYQKLKDGIRRHQMVSYFEVNEDEIDADDAKLYKLIEE